METIDLSSRVSALWYSPKRSRPSDGRDVLVFCTKPVYVQEKKRFQRMDAMEVIHFEEGTWWMAGKILERKHIHRWTEIPEGWNK